MAPDLSDLEKVELRDVWQDEAKEFTPWLSESDGIKRLGNALGMDLELLGTEQSIGRFSADIVCNDTLSNTKVLIENQLEKTNHDHLGKLLTYTAGLQTSTIIWIAQHFQDEHRAALDLLNEITDSKYRFFGIEIELWKIENSKPAPKFNIVSKPNDWSRTIARASRSGEMSQTDQMRFDYWTRLKNYLVETDSPLVPQTPAAQHFMHFHFGKSGARLVAHALVKPAKIRVGFETFAHNKDALYNFLYEQRATIHEEVGFELEWENQSSNQYARAWFGRDDKFSESENWDRYCEWMKVNLEKLLACIKPKLSDFNPNNNSGEA